MKTNKAFPLPKVVEADGRFKAGHSYRPKERGTQYPPIMCIGTAPYSGTFKQKNSFSVKNHNKRELYDDLGIRSLRGLLYSALNRLGV